MKRLESGSTAVVFLGLVLLLGFLALAWLSGTRAMCAMHHDQIRYCDGYVAPTTSTQEPAR